MEDRGGMTVFLDPDGRTGHGLLELGPARELFERAASEAGWPDRSSDVTGLTAHQRGLLAELREFEQSSGWST